MSTYKSFLYRLKNIDLNFYYNYFNNNAVILRYWDKTTNFGDFMNPFIVSSILNKQVDSSFRVFNVLKQVEILGMGSIISGNLSNCVIWGSGVKKPEEKLTHLPIKVLQVRGPKSKKFLETYNVKVPDKFGDPALLLPDLYQPVAGKKYKLGIIPHYVDQDKKAVRALLKRGDPEIKFINVMDPYKKIIDEINSCEFIASSSLHGLIVAEAYGIPTLRLIIGEKIEGGSFKFNDHYLGVGVNSHDRLFLDESTVLDSSFYSRFSLKDIKFDNRFMKGSLIDFCNGRTGVKSKNNVSAGSAKGIKSGSKQILKITHPGRREHERCFGLSVDAS